MDVHPNIVLRGELTSPPVEFAGALARVGRHWFRAVHVRGGRNRSVKTRVGRHWFCAVHVRDSRNRSVKTRAATDGFFAKLVVGIVSTAMAAAAIRITVLACFIFLSSRANWPLGQEENKERGPADAESERNAWETKQ